MLIEKKINSLFPSLLFCCVFSFFWLTNNLYSIIIFCHFLLILFIKSFLVSLIVQPCVSFVSYFYYYS
jgi:hypothetical protein